MLGLVCICLPGLSQGPQIADRGTIPTELKKVNYYPGILLYLYFDFYILVF